MELKPIQGGFGAVVSQVRLEGPGLERTVRELEHALDEHLLLVLRDTNLDLQGYVRLGREFGELESFGGMGVAAELPCIAISNADAQGRILPAGDPARRMIAADALWHTDNTYRTRRARYSLLKAERVPSRGGETEFCDTRAAYESLTDEARQRLEGLVALHSILYSRGLTGFTEWTDEQRAALHPVPQPLVFENERTGRRSLYLASHIAEIVGWPTPEARALARELIEFATRPQFVYAHRWCPGDLVIWDDRATMHRRAPYDDLTEVRKLFTMRVVEPSDLYDPRASYEIH